MAQVKPKSLGWFTVGTLSVIGFTVFVFTYPPIQRRFAPEEYPVLFGTALLFVTAVMVATGVKLFGNLQTFQRTRLASLFVKPSFYFGIFVPSAAGVLLITRSWVLFMVIMIVGGILRILSRKAGARV